MTSQGVVDIIVAVSTGATMVIHALRANAKRAANRATDRAAAHQGGPDNTPATDPRVRPDPMQ